MLSHFINVDHHLFFLINDSLNHRALDSVFEGLSWMGGWTVGLLTLTLMATEGRRSLARHGLILALFVTLTAAVTDYLKRTIERPRPTVVFAEHPRTADGPRLRVLELNAPQRHAFPSGHSMTAFFMLVYAGQRRREFRPWFLALATGIALGRVYVGVHFPLDCLAGAILGTLGALLASATFHKLENRLWTHPPMDAATTPATAAAP